MNMTSSPLVLLSENDISGASLEGRVPAALKKYDLCFESDTEVTCKGLNVKAQIMNVFFLCVGNIYKEKYCNWLICYVSCNCDEHHENTN